MFVCFIYIYGLDTKNSTKLNNKRKNLFLFRKGGNTVAENTERRSRQALSKKARVDATSTARGLEGKPSAPRKIVKRPVPVKAEKPDQTETKPAEVNEEVTKQVTEQPAKKKETKKHNGGTKPMTIKKIEDVISAISAKTKLEDVTVRSPKSKEITLEDKAEILSSLIGDEKDVEVSRTACENIIRDYETIIAGLIQDGATVKFKGSVKRKVDGYYFKEDEAVKVRKATAVPGKNIPEDETYYIQLQNNGFKLIFDFGEKRENIKGKLSEDGSTFIAKDGRQFKVFKDENKNN